MGYQVMNKIEMEPSGLSETYFHTMMRLMGENRDIMELEADLGVCILGGGYKEMEQTYPKQLFNCGIQEANMDRGRLWLVRGWEDPLLSYLCTVLGSPCQ